MSAYDRQPTNRNFLSPLGFKFVLNRAPGIEYFVQTANVPSLSMNNPNVPTPFVSLPMAGDHIQFGDFSVTFKIDEDLANYLEIYNWMIGIGFPDNYDQSKWAQKNRDDIYSDAKLLINTSAKNPHVEVTFLNIFPVDLSSIDFDTTQTDVEFVSVTATFKYQKFSIAMIV